jgi:hypothetical protein
MARKATDLLDVFRYGGDEDENDSGQGVSSERRRSKKKRKKAVAKPPADRKGFRGLILSQRQVVLAGSACCLLVVLSFVLGVTAGRPGSGDTPAIRKDVADSSRWFVIQGELDQVHPATQKALDPAKVRTDLVRDYRLRSQNLRIREGDRSLLLEVGPFRTEQRARDFLRDSGLDMAHLYGADPFLGARIVPFRR